MRDWWKGSGGFRGGGVSEFTESSARDHPGHFRVESFWKTRVVVVVATDEDRVGDIGAAEIGVAQVGVPR